MDIKNAFTIGALVLATACGAKDYGINTNGLPLPTGRSAVGSTPVSATGTIDSILPKRGCDGHYMVLIKTADGKLVDGTRSVVSYGPADDLYRAAAGQVCSEQIDLEHALKSGMPVTIRGMAADAHAKSMDIAGLDVGKHHYGALTPANVAAYAR